LNLQKVFETRPDRPWQAFKSGGHWAAHFLKVNCLIVKIFGGFQNRQVGSGQLSNALGAALRNLLSKRSKGCGLAGFENLFTNSIAFRAKRLRDLLVQYKIKGAIKKKL
jgi:hypothetical protein